MNALVQLGFWDLVVATLLVVVAGAVSLALRLGLTSRLGIAASRTVVQLLGVGLILKWVFDLDRWWLVVLVLGIMTLNAGLAAVRRTRSRYRGIWANGLLSVSVSGLLVLTVVSQAVVGVDPWWSPRYLIPLLGMILGNSLTGISLTLDRLLTDLSRRRAEVDGWLACGATAWEAARPLVADAVRTGMIPILNAMTVVGLASLPGMMTGQILGGAPPMEAVKYQIVVMFMIAASVSLGALMAALLAFRRLATRDHQLATHRLRQV